MKTWSLFYYTAIFILLLPSLALASEERRPNILFFLVDDMGVTDTSVQFLQDVDGQLIHAPLNDRYRTPHLARLANQGMRFTNAYAYSVCTPTRVSLLSGVYATRLHITTWTHPHHTLDTGQVSEGGVRGPRWKTTGLSTDRLTLPRLLGQAGYRTICCGKAHFGPNDTLAGNPLNLGFDINIAGHGAGAPGSYLGKQNFARKGKRPDVWTVPGLEKYHGQDVFLTEALTRELKQTISQTVNDNRPFFAYMAHYAVHSPFQVDKRFAGNYPNLQGKALAFATMVEGMDKSLGDLLDHLQTLGVAEETLVIFYSDNGSDGPPNRPLRGIKGSRFLGGNRVPLVAAWAKPNAQHPAQQACPISAGSIEDDLVTPVDFLPTLAAIAQVRLPKGVKLDGHNLSPYLRGLSGTHRPQQFLLHFPHGRHRSQLYTTWTDDGWKLTYEYAARRWHLHHLTSDLGEQQNLIDQHPNRALAMARQMVAELDRQQAQYPRTVEDGSPVRPDLQRLEALVAKAGSRTD